MADDRGATGRRAEQAVVDLLISRGFVIVARNVRAGRLELDIIARKGPLLVVCEVRSRRDPRFGSPVETIDRHKIQRIRRATAQWLRENRPGTSELRFDAAAVLFAPDGSYEIEYFEEAF